VNPIAAIVLAGGASRRMGSPKALLDWNGETALDRWTRLLAAHFAPVIAVLGQYPERIREGIRHPERAVFVTNPDPDRGQLSSLQTGLAAVPDVCDGVAFTPVDFFAVQPGTLAMLADAWRRRADGTERVAPQWQGRHGHPVIVSQFIRRELLALPETAQAREVIHRYRPQTQWIDVADPGVVEDADDPESFALLRERTTQR
jgi:molybdenum cofactor cytidylyltransferase